MPLKNRIRYWRLRLGAWNLQEFADIIGFSAWMVERWEGQKMQPTLEAVCRIKERLLPHYPEITLEDLVDYIPEKQTAESAGC